MSLHLNRQCQRADALPPPVRLFRASVVPTKKRHETNADLSKEAASAAVSAIYGGGPKPSTGFLQLCCARPSSSSGRASVPRLGSNITSEGHSSRPPSCWLGAFFYLSSIFGDKRKQRRVRAQSSASGGVCPVKGGRSAANQRVRRARFSRMRRFHGPSLMLSRRRRGNGHARGRTIRDS